MHFQTFTVAFDDGPDFEVTNNSRDFLRMEEDGIDLNTLSPIRGSYTIAWYALRRLERLDKLDGFRVPEFETFIDTADINTVADEDPEGNGSAPEATTGS